MSGGVVGEVGIVKLAGLREVEGARLSLSENIHLGRQECRCSLGWRSRWSFREWLGTRERRKKGRGLRAPLEESVDLSSIQETTEHPCGFLVLLEEIGEEVGGPGVTRIIQSLDGLAKLTGRSFVVIA